MPRKSIKDLEILTGITERQFDSANYEVVAKLCKLNGVNYNGQILLLKEWILSNPSKAIAWHIVDQADAIYRPQKANNFHLCSMVPECYKIIIDTWEARSDYNKGDVKYAVPE